MKIISPSTEIIAYTPNILDVIEGAARTCYMSEPKRVSGRLTSWDNKEDEIWEDKREQAEFLKRIISKGHLSVLEHGSITVDFIVDRGVSHELVRHRVASFSQSSTRYCNYSKDKFGNELTFIKPCFWEENDSKYLRWKEFMAGLEVGYMALIREGVKPEEARSILPNSLMTKIRMTANVREWRHVFELRCSPAAHPQMREVMIPLREEFVRRWPVLFGHEINTEWS